jgi:hypothetical protein
MLKQAPTEKIPSVGRWGWGLVPVDFGGLDEGSSKETDTPESGRGQQYG